MAIWMDGKTNEPNPPLQLFSIQVLNERGEGKGGLSRCFNGLWMESWGVGTGIGIGNVSRYPPIMAHALR